MAKLTSLEAINSNEVNLQDGLYLAHKVSDDPDIYEDRRLNINKLAGALPTEDINYDNTESGLTATDVQGAIDELAAGGRENLGDLTDVTITDPAANQLLQYNSTTEKWENKKYIEGTGNTVTGANAHAEGASNTASGVQAHAEGSGTQATEANTHSEGAGCRATNSNAHAEGAGTLASGAQSHAEGGGSQATASQAHAEGGGCNATAQNSHAEGCGTIAASENQHAGGRYNIEDNQDVYAEIIGNGTNDTSVTPAVLTRNNARTLDWSGNEMIAGDLTFMGNKSLNTMLPDPPATDGTYTLQCTVLNGVATYAWV